MAPFRTIPWVVGDRYPRTDESSPPENEGAETRFHPGRRRSSRQCGGAPIDGGGDPARVEFTAFQYPRSFIRAGAQATKDFDRCVADRDWSLATEHEPGAPIAASPARGRRSETANSQRDPGQPPGSSQIRA